MTQQPYDVIVDECQDDWCPECFGDDVIDLPDGTQMCVECRAIIDY